MESFDYQDQFERVKKDIVTSLKKTLDIQSAGNNRQIVVNKIWIDDNKDPADWESQKQAVRKDRTWGVPVYASVDLVNRKTGAVYSSEERIKIATLPRPTNLGSFIVDGKHYQVQSQLRRKPGVYMVERRNKQLKTEINIQKRPFDIDMDPETQIFKMKKAGSEQAFALYPILSRLGVSDAAMARKWGDDVLAANKAIKPKAAKVAVTKAATFFTGKNFDSEEDAVAAIKEFFSETEIRPEVTKSTLGKAYTKVTPDLILRGSEELLKANRGERDSDDRQALEYKKVMGMSDLMSERMLQKDGQLAGNMASFRTKLSRKLGNRKRPPTEISKLIKTNELTPFFTKFFSESSLSNTTDQTNPITMLNGTAKITVLGEGGVMDATRVRGEERSVHPSQMGFIDPIHTPDSSNIGLVMNLPLGVTKEGENLKTKVIDPKTKKTRRISPSEARNLVIAFPDQYSKGEFTGKTVRAFVNGKFENVAASKVDVVLASSKQAFSIASNTIPFLASAQGVRAQMATKMLEQAIPLTNREAPLVQVGLGSGTIEKSVGEGFSIQALENGVIEKIEEGRIVIKTVDGRVEQKLYKDIPLNKKSFLTSNIVDGLKVGDSVTRGQVIADSNFTKGGRLALGTNLRAAYIAYKGYNFEDGIVITESAAKKLTSEHMNEFSSSIEKGTKVSIKDFMAWKAGGMELKQRNKLDKDGVVKIGQTVHMGDPLWVGTKENKYDPDYIAEKKMNPNADPRRAYMEEWTKSSPGVVVDVVKSDGKIKVYVKSKEPAVIGDKLCYSPDHEVLTDRGWIPIKEASYSDKIATISPDGDLEYHKPTWVCRYDDIDEDMYSLETQQVSLFVTTNHSLYVKKRDAEKFELIPAIDCIGKRVRHKKNAFWVGKLINDVEVPGYIVKCGRGGVGRKNVAPVKFETDDFLRLLGFFIAEGWCESRKEGGDYRIGLSQTKKVGREFIESVCGRLGIHLVDKKEKGQSVGYIIYSRHLWEWFKSCGCGALEKRIPEWVLELSPKHLSALWDGLHAGDGSTSSSGSQSYFTSSEKLSGQIQELALKLGWAANLKERPAAPGDLIIRGRKTSASGPSFALRIVKSKCEPQINHGHTHEQNAQTEKLVPYRGSVYCLEVPHHVIYVRRNGKPVWCGNTNRHGAKGIISKIIPDGEAPYTADGRAVDILLNPHGVVTRINPSQILETAAAKIAEKEGKPYIVNNFTGENYTESVTRQVQEAGLSDLETLYDPHTKKPLGEVLVGPQYTLKLSKQATSQFSARSEGKYDADMAPMKGGEDGAKALDMLTFYSMLSHGARSNIREMATYKATENKEFWRWVERGSASGMITPPPSPTLAYKKFEAYMKGAGVNMERRGSKMALGPMTDAQTMKLSNGKVRDATFLRAKDLRFERGGLMDPNIFGEGDKWGHFELAESIPNPVFEKPIKALTGMNDQMFKAVVKGQRFIDPKTNEWNDKKGLTGGAAIAHVLKGVDIDKEIEIWTDKAKKTKSEGKLNEANKRLRYLAALKKLNMRPEEAYIQKKIPIIPTKFRKIIEMEGGALSNAGLNSLYRDVGLINDQLKWQKTIDYMPESVKAELRSDLYDSVKSVSGLGKQIHRGVAPESKRPKGIIEQIKGQKAKEGFFQSKVLRRTQNLVGRGTIIPDPKLGVDQVGLPEEMSWSLFEKFVTRRLVNSGYAPADALEAIEARSGAARAALEMEMENRPVMLNRAPSLHKFSIQSFMPQMVDGKAIKIPPLIVGGFNADFDGDAMTVHVPILNDAVAEAKKMLPSRNLYSPGTGDVMIRPQNESALGIYRMSIDPNLKSKVLDTLPTEAKKKFANRPLDGKGLSDLMKHLALEIPDGHGAVVDKLKAMGDDHTYKTGFTVGLKDLTPDVPEREEIFAATRKKISKLDTSTRAGKQKAGDIISAADKELEAILGKRLDEQGNAFRMMVRSGARGNMRQLKQIVSAPFSVPDHRGELMAEPVTASFAEGLPFSDYWNTLYGARSVATDKQLQTRLPGAFNKDIMASSIVNVISGDDCKTTRGVNIDLGLKIRDAEDRFLAKDISVGGTVIARAGSLVSTGLLNTLRDRKVGTIKVRSPLTCSKPKGTCAKCFGLNENGNLPNIGDNIGATAGQALSEPLTQMTLRTFHSGGVGGGRGVVSGYDKIDKLFKMPKIKRGRATLAQTDGTIESVRNAPGGTGKHIKITGSKKSHFVEKDLWDAGKSRVGRKVFRGDILSKGLVQPQELVELKGMQAAQEYLVDEIQDAYQSQGVDLRRKTVETVIRAVANNTKIHDPGDSQFIIGDVAPWTVVEDYNNRSLGKMSLDKIIGLALKEDVPGIRKGTVVSERVRATLERMGKTEVEVGNRPIAHQPFLKGVEQVPMLRDDWMSQMGYRNLAKAITEGAANLSESDLHGYSPIPGFAYGAEFGLPGGKLKEEGVY